MSAQLHGSCLNIHGLIDVYCSSYSFKRLNEKHLLLQAANKDLRDQFDQQEATLVEMGSVHAKEKLEMTELRARQRRAREAAMKQQEMGKGGKKPPPRPGPGKGGDKREFANGGINLGALTGQR